MACRDGLPGAPDGPVVEAAAVNVQMQFPDAFQAIVVQRLLKDVDEGAGDQPVTGDGGDFRIGSPGGPQGVGKGHGDQGARVSRLSEDGSAGEHFPFRGPCGCGIFQFMRQYGEYGAGNEQECQSPEAAGDLFLRLGGRHGRLWVAGDNTGLSGFPASARYLSGRPFQALFF